jgi:hypothetical protein
MRHRERRIPGVALVKLGAANRLGDPSRVRFRQHCLRPSSTRWGLLWVASCQKGMSRRDRIGLRGDDQVYGLDFPDRARG